MILTELPDLLPRPPTLANAAFRRWFYERWGRENAIILGRARRAEFPPFRQALSIKRAWGGHEDYLLDSRRLRVDEAHCLVLNEGAEYGARIESAGPVTSMAVFFRPNMAQELAAAAFLSGAAVLDRGLDPPQRPSGFGEHLRLVTAGLERRLCALRDAVLAGEDDEQWLEEELQDLLWEMWAAELGWRRRGLVLTGMCRSAYAELLSRVDRATDFMLSCHTQSITLDEIAAAARLSKYHLVRVFREVHAITPMVFLNRQRAFTAQRLIEQGGLGLDEVARVCGFGSRQTLFRQLRRHCGGGGRSLRGLATTCP